MTLYERMCRCLHDHYPQGPIYIAFSGGLDSTVLLVLAARLAAEQDRNFVPCTCIMACRQRPMPGRHTVCGWQALWVFPAGFCR